MKVTIAAAMSADGKITRHGEPDVSKWVSEQDHEHFEKLKAEYQVMVVGSTVYELMKDFFKRDKAKLLRTVLTGRPADYAQDEIPGQLEFRTMTPAELVASLESRGFKGLLVVGGTRMMTEFLAADLVDVIYLTIEPRLFGAGTPLLSVEQELNVELRLQEARQLNDAGTMLMTYEVVK